MTGEVSVELSIVIPTHNRAKSLNNLIQSLRNIEEIDRFRLEVIVVNNDSQDETALLLDEEQKYSHLFEFRVLEEKKRGKANALNVGLKTAQGQILMVLDDDVVIHPAALRNHLGCYRLHSFDAVQGRVLPGNDSNGGGADPNRLHEYNIPHIDYGNVEREIRGLTGTNMSFRREVFKTVGPFDARLGPGASGFSEDTEFSMRVRKAGFKIGYTPHAVVYHELDPGRIGRAYNRKVEYRKGQSRSIYRRDSILTIVLPNLLMNCIRYVIYKALQRNQKAYKTEGRIMKCWGQMVGTFQSRTKRKQAA